MRRIIIGASRDIEYDIRNDFFARLQQMPLGYYQARRTGDLMSRATNDLNAVRMMIGPAVMYSANTVLVFVVAIVLMLSIDGRLTLIALMPLPFVSISVKYFGSAIHQRSRRSRRSSPSSARSSRKRSSGVRVVRAYSQEAHEIERFAAANEEYVRRNRVLIRLQGLFYPSMTLFLGLRVAARALARQPRGDPRPHHARRVRRLQRLPRDAQLADDCVRLGHQHPPARHGLVEADARGARRDARHQRRARHARPAARRRSPAPSRSAISPSRTRDRPAGARRRLAAHRAGPDRRVRRRDRLRQVDADQPAAAPARAAAGHGVHRRRRRPRDPAGDAARRDRLRAAGAVPVLGHDRREHRVRRPGRRARTGTPDLEQPGVAEAAAVARLDKDVESFPKRVRDDGRRARHHAVGRAEAAHRARARADGRSPRS